MQTQLYSYTRSPYRLKRVENLKHTFMSQFIALNTIIGNGKSYQVPIYQRDYSWDKDDWEDLWNDIEEIPNDKTHYLGYLVLQKNQEIGRAHV